MTSIVSILQILGVLTGLLAIWLFLCDHTNEFAARLFGASFLMLGIGWALGWCEIALSQIK
jgi:hypothetical protein